MSAILKTQSANANTAEDWESEGSQHVLSFYYVPGLMLVEYTHHSRAFGIAAV